jgi:hypothetical protein
VHASYTQEVLGAFLFLGIFNKLAKKNSNGPKNVYFWFSGCLICTSKKQIAKPNV